MALARKRTSTKLTLPFLVFYPKLIHYREEAEEALEMGSLALRMGLIMVHTHCLEDLGSAMAIIH